MKSEDAWRQMGRDIKTIREQLIHFIDNPDHLALVTKKEMAYISKALRQVDHFRGLAEERMYKKLKPQPGDQSYLKIFYGPLNREGGINP